MRVLMFVRKFNDSTHTFIYNTVKGVAARGHDVMVLCVQRMYEDKYPFPNVEVANISVLQRFVSNRLHQFGIRLNYKNSPLSKSIKKVLSDFSPDIIHCHFGPDALYFLDNYKGSLPVVVHFHGFDASNMLRDKLYRGRLREVFSYAHVYPIFVSNYMYQGILDAEIFPSEKFILYYGTDTDFFTPGNYRVDSRFKTFVQISSLREKKGHIYTLQAFAKWHQKYKRDNWQLLFTGDGPSLKHLKNKTKELGLSEFIRWVGFVDRAKAKELLERADVFVHHSITAANGDKEGIPNSIMEAMSMELPVLATKHAGIPELVEDGVNGYLVEERDVDAFAQKIEDIFTWEKQPNNRKKIMRYFEKKRHAENLEKIYERILGSRR